MGKRVSSGLSQSPGRRMTESGIRLPARSKILRTYDFLEGCLRGPVVWTKQLVERTVLSGRMIAVEVYLQTKAE